MESGNSKAASSEEEAAVRSHSPAVAAARARPYYGCVFCKRGFTTAQALGGHMNVHRRDRAKPVRLPTECTLVYPPAPPVSSGGFSMLYYARNTGGRVKEEAVSRGSPTPRELSLFGADDGTDDRDLQLSLRCHGSGRALEGPSEWWQDGELPERKLDLELRLGPRPRN
ncbi:zinc finger protein 11-like [Triticum urartu]|uniref:zinc finger protein 11-like n=1 Tax=Triticum dicoccoides TaxID=85692 RepID=UPI0018903BBE|nr:zinc finger protein 11-like [Triticum dicoccoides]XP_044361201.1 zinc finger protein 11-like [Triticum aestivum]XP_048573808.1 zinc finger protein 11-like [Triticum urartu]